MVLPGTPSSPSSDVLKYGVESKEKENMSHSAMTVIQADGTEAFTALMESEFAGGQVSERT